MRFEGKYYLASKNKIALLDIMLKNGSFKICGNTL